MKAMNIKNIGIVLGIIFFSSLTINLKAQSSIDLRINEFLVFNDSNYVDDFGMPQPWIEIFNSAYNSVNIGGLYLTNDLSNPTMYHIPKGQPVTSIPSQGYLVFWADNEPSRGILHLNFDLENSKIIALFDANGKTLIDSVSIPREHKSDITYGRTTNGGSEWSYLEKSTPNASNVFQEIIPASVTFKKMDPTGAGMVVIAMTVVFSGLAFLYLFFKLMGKMLNRSKVKTTVKENVTVQVPKESEVTGEINAAIAMALYMYQNEMHDSDQAILTINKVSRNYSPWSSKIYGLRKMPGQL